MPSQFPKHDVSDMTLSLLSHDSLPLLDTAISGGIECSVHGRCENETHFGVTMLGSSLMRLGMVLMCSRREIPGSMLV